MGNSLILDVGDKFTISGFNKTFEVKSVVSTTDKEFKDFLVDPMNAMVKVQAVENDNELYVILGNG